MSRIKQDGRMVRLGVYCALYAACGVLLYFASIRGLFMVWNLFLALLPLVFAAFAEKNKGPAVCFAAALLWLLFFPNAPYMITDLIHVPPHQSYWSGGEAAILISWIRLVYIGSGALLGNLAGLMSLDKMRRLAVKARGKAIAGFALTAVFLLSGYAIYLGRYLRFNSWDVIRPLYMLSRLAENLNGFSAAYSLLFAVYIAFSYAVYRAVFAGGE